MLRVLLFLFLFPLGHKVLADAGRAHPAYSKSAVNLDLQHSKPHPLLLKLKKDVALSRKLTAAILAFPFPFGIVGIHRIYLGSAPYVPVVYIATLGGVFGLLPFI